MTDYDRIQGVSGVRLMYMERGKVLRIRFASCWSFCMSIGIPGST